jgi:hypothetical protein
MTADESAADAHAALSRACCLFATEAARPAVIRSAASIPGTL